MNGRPLVRDRDTALYLGLGLWIAGAVLLWDAWEHRGKRRPLVMRVAAALA
jgi:hypothetical protein